MANPFDQFDAAPSGGAPAAPAAAPNPFDQFDTPATPAPVQASGDAGSPAPDPSSQAPWTLQSAVLPALNGMVRSAANHVPFVGGLADTLDAKTDALLTGKSADQAMADQKGMDQQFADQHPVLDTAAGIAGAGAGTAAVLPNAMLGLGSAPLLSRMGAAAAGGALVGGGDAAVRGSNPALGAAEGAVAGAGGPLAGAGLGAAWRGVTGLMSGAPSALPGVGRAGARIVAQDFAGETPQSLAAAAQDIGPNGMVGELTPGAMDTLGGIADTPGAAKPIVRNAYAARNAGAMSRANGIMDQGFGPQVDMATLQRDTAAARSAAADPLYAQWRDTAVPTTPELQDVLSRPSVQSAIPDAARKAGDQGRSIYASPAQRGSWEPDPLGSGAVPEMPTDLPEPPSYGDTPAPTRPGPVGVPRPQDLHAFVRSLGGIQDRGGDLAAMGYDNLIARPGQGLGADAMRQAAAQMGYLNHTIDGSSDSATRFSTVNDLLDALGSDNPIYSANDEDAVHAWAARDAAMQDWQQRGGAGADPTARPAGPRPMAPGLPFGGGADLNGTGAAPQLTAEGLDYIKRALGDRIDAAQRGGNNDDARIYTGLKNQLVGAVDNHPDPDVAGVWKQARQAWSDPTSLMNAREAGQQVFTRAQRADELAHEFGALSDPEKAAYLQGARDHVGEILGATTRGDTTARNILLSPNGQAKLQTLLGPDQADAVTRSLGHEAFYREAATNVVGGSQTTPKAQRTAKVSPTGVNSLASGLADYADQFTWGRMSSWVPPFMQPRQLYNRAMEGSAERARGEVANLYTKSGPERDALFDVLLQQAQRRAALAPPPNTDPLVLALMASGQRARQGAE